METIARAPAPESTAKPEAVKLVHSMRNSLNALQLACVCLETGSVDEVLLESIRQTISDELKQLKDLVREVESLLQSKA
jgi:hypothetical protein